MAGRVAGAELLTLDRSSPFLKGNRMATTATQRKVLAVLAGGLVLGVGAAVTLAAWNDSEFATGTFQAGDFNLEGSETSAAAGWADHEAAPGAPLGFTLPLAGNLAPEDVVYAPFWLRLDDTTTTGATVTTSLDSGTGANAANISYAVYAIDEADACDASAVAGGTLLLSGGTLTASTPGATFDLTAGAPDVAGDAQKVCFVVTAEDTLAEGGAASATWEFAATSTD